MNSINILFRNSPNPYMWMSMELIYNQNTRLRVLTSLDLNRLMQSKPEHAEIIDALFLKIDMKMLQIR